MERFKPRTRQNKTRPVVSYSSNQFRFNVVAGKEYIKDNIFVNMFYDKINKRVGFIFCKEENEATLRLCNSRGTFVVSGKAFMDCFKLNAKGKFFLVKDGDYIMFNLKQQESKQ